MPWVGKRMDRKRHARRSRGLGGFTVEDFNQELPIGTPVIFTPVHGVDSIPKEHTKTRSEAWALGDGSVVVLVEGRTGGVAATHLELDKEAST